MYPHVHIVLLSVQYSAILYARLDALQSGREIVSTDGGTGGTGEFAVLDLISVKEERLILIVLASQLQCTCKNQETGVRYLW